MAANGTTTRSWIAIAQAVALSSALAASGGAALAAPASVSVYSESAYVSQDDNVVSATHLRLDLATRAWGEATTAIYGALNLEQDLRSDATSTFNDNRVSPALGLRAGVPLLPGLSLGGFAEYRRDFRVVSRPRERQASESDWRGGAWSYGLWPEIRPARGQTILPFDELYSEAVASTRIGPSLSAQTWNKAGLRQGLGGRIVLDGYLEALLKRSSLDYPGENLQELGPGARLGWSGERFAAAVSARRGYGARASGREPYAEWTGLLFLSGEL